MSQKPDASFLPRARKRFGQNFLHDQGVIDQIIRAVAPGAEDNLLEIGPGTGALTERLLAACPALRALELDRDLVPPLRVKFFNYPDFRIIVADALKYDYTELGHSLRIVGNLPYNISTPLLFRLLEYKAQIRDMTFMLQREVVERMGAVPGTADYGRLSVMLQYHARVTPLFDVGPGAFVPAPKVWSSVVRIEPRPPAECKAVDENNLAIIVRQAFSQRRKTLRNVMRGFFSAERIEALGLDPAARPETLRVQDFVMLSNQLERPGGLGGSAAE